RIDVVSKANRELAFDQLAALGYLEVIELTRFSRRFEELVEIYMYKNRRSPEVQELSRRIQAVNQQGSTEDTNSTFNDYGIPLVGQAQFTGGISKEEQEKYFEEFENFFAKVYPEEIARIRRMR